ncbi:MAG: hypothetical protein IT258_09825 [Saprospiraceae bacterium]|nr:hypothetical protein [Saprospiraceae bacterium]
MAAVLRILELRVGEMRIPNRIRLMVGILALTIVASCSLKTALFDLDKIYCDGTCSTSELQLNSDSSFYVVHTTCDIAAYEVSFGRFDHIQDSIFFIEDIEYYFSRNSKIKEFECEERKLTFKLKEHCPIDYGSGLIDFYAGVLIIGENSVGEIDTIPRGMVRIGRETDLERVSIEVEKLKVYDEIWLQYKGAPIGLKVMNPKSSACIEIDYPIFKSFGQSLNHEWWKLKPMKVKEITEDEIVLKTKCKILKSEGGMTSR